ncbi:MAG: hypothetical protein HY683_04470 [Chloroflexi bacterium]|nr:hypothetical protein [Chloroflexota bacterium]
MSGPGGRFLGQEVEVTAGGLLSEPLAFRLKGREHRVAQVLATWADYGYPSERLSYRRWWMRRHRTYYRVRTTDGEVYELYLDRGTRLEARRRWFLTRQL